MHLSLVMYIDEKKYEKIHFFQSVMSTDLNG